MSATDEGDIVLDPVCGSGTTLVAAKSLKRQWIGIDCSHEAIEISRRRLAATPDTVEVKHHAPYRLARFLKLSRSAKVEYIAERLDMHIVQRNGNIDGFLKKTIDGVNVAVRYIESDEPKTVINQFVQAIEKKQSKLGIVVMSHVSKKEKEAIENKFGTSVQIFVISYQNICENNFNIEDVINGRQLTLAL